MLTVLDAAERSSTMSALSLPSSLSESLSLPRGMGSEERPWRSV
jgi:hypothetical protein